MLNREARKAPSLAPFFQKINLKKNKKMFFAIGKRKKVPYMRVNLWFYAKG